MDSKQPQPAGTSFAQLGVQVPFLDWLGVQLVSMQDGRSELILQPQSHHLNSWHVLHGGVIMTLLDVAMATAGRSLQANRTGGNVTVEMKTTFIRPCNIHSAGGRIAARGHCYHQSTTMAFCEGQVFDDQGQLCASATGTFKFLKRLRGKTDISNTSSGDHT